MLSLKSSEYLIQDNKRDFILSVCFIIIGLFLLAFGYTAYAIVSLIISLYFDNSRNRDLIRLEIRNGD